MFDHLHANHPAEGMEAGKVQHQLTNALANQRSNAAAVVDHHASNGVLWAKEVQRAVTTLADQVMKECTIKHVASISFYFQDLHYLGQDSQEKIITHLKQLGYAVTDIRVEETGTPPGHTCFSIKLGFRS